MYETYYKQPVYKAIKLSDKISIPNVILAPMSGVTDMPFRQIVNKLGAGLVVSEMIASRAVLIKLSETLKKSQFNEGELTAVQLAGFEPDVLAEAAKIHVDHGAQIIDLNFGCPVKKVVNGYAGSALMRDEEKAFKIIDAVVKSVPVPVTLKMRMGWNHESLNAPKIAKFASDCGIKMITIHGRTRCQLYKGKADWEFIKKVKDVVNVPVIANGDIKEFNDIKEAMYLSNADGIMIGRGIYGKPWFIKQAIDYMQGKENYSAIDKNIKIDIIKEHYQNMLYFYGKEKGMRMARKHLSWYSNSMYNSSLFRAKIIREENSNIVMKEIDKLFAV